MQFQISKVLNEREISNLLYVCQASLGTIDEDSQSGSVRCRGGQAKD